MNRITKLCLSNFLTGLVFWYGIEKLFMKSIGIDAVGIGAASAVILIFTIVFDIPAGILADKWSRKAIIIVSTLCLGIASVILGLSNGLSAYLIGYGFYGIYIVCTSGIEQAIMYDSLHEEGRSNEYSKIMGRAYALFLVGAGVANIASGFIAKFWGLRFAFFAALIPCFLNIILLIGLKEPTFHKNQNKEKVLRQLVASSRTIGAVAILRSLILVSSVMFALETFKSEFSQLYMLRFVSSAVALGLLWAAYAFTWALGSFLAHRLQSKLSLLIMVSLMLLIALGSTTSVWGIGIFMVEAVLSGAIYNLIEMNVQNATPSEVRASVMSVMSTLGRLVALPAVFFFGWIIRTYDVFWALRSVALFSFILLIYWVLVGRKRIAGSIATEPAETSASYSPLLPD
ncbi:MAG TPA: MFS transporter [Candidatus Saccharimonadales bacterium]|nr:MFS transporter [Candidatus Saccharimonadales bacterium]